MYRIFYINANIFKILDKVFSDFGEALKFCKDLEKNPLVTKIWIRDNMGKNKYFFEKTIDKP